jgi:hypothetical protein
MPWNFTSFFRELLPDNRVPLLANDDQAGLTAAEASRVRRSSVLHSRRVPVAIVYRFHVALRGEVSARRDLIIALDSNCSSSAQVEELAALELGCSRNPSQRECSQRGKYRIRLTVSPSH